MRYVPAVLALLFAAPLAAQIPAFPEAQGWGAMALNNCRNLPLVVHKVENLSTSGTGSLRHILENQLSNSNYDIVIFRTGGTLIDKNIEANASCVYMAGQTAPGDGFMVRSPSLGSTLVRFVTNAVRTDIVVRYMRFRHGIPCADCAINSGTGAGLVFSGSGGAQRIIVDHVSTSWAGGSSHLGVSRLNETAPHSEFLTFQNSIVAEGFQHRGSLLRDMRRMSVYRNLWATHGQRAPLVQQQGIAAADPQLGVEVINNVMYNNINRTTEAQRQASVDWIKNYVDTGPHRGWTTGRTARWHNVDANDPGSLYVEGNFITSGFNGTDWTYWRETGTGALLPSNFQRFTRMPPPPVPIDPERSPADARTWVLANAGASRKLNCAGEWVNARDPVDTRIINYVTTRSAQTTPVNALNMTVEQIHGGWPNMAQGTACTDTDGDGIPDAWETAWCGTSTCAVASNVTASGYLTIECYLNGPNSCEEGGGGDPPPPTLPDSAARNYYVKPLTLSGGRLVATFSGPLAGFRAACKPPSCATGLEALIVSRSYLTADTPLHEAQVDSICTSWGWGASECNRRVKDPPVPGGTSLRAPSPLWRFLALRMRPEYGWRG